MFKMMHYSRFYGPYPAYYPDKNKLTSAMRVNGHPESHLYQVRKFNFDAESEKGLPALAFAVGHHRVVITRDINTTMPVTGLDDETYYRMLGLPNPNDQMSGHCSHQQWVEPGEPQR